MKKTKPEAINLRALDRNIESMQRMRSESDESRSWDQKMADAVTEFLGHTQTIYIHIFFYGGLIALAIFFISKELFTWPESISILGSVATLETLFLTLFILINQRRMKSLERKDSDLHLQMSLLGEHEITRLIQMTDSIMKHFKIIADMPPQDLKELKKEINPDQIVEKIVESESREISGSKPKL